MKFQVRIIPKVLARCNVYRVENPLMTIKHLIKMILFYIRAIIEINNKTF